MPAGAAEGGFYVRLLIEYELVNFVLERSRTCPTKTGRAVRLPARRAHFVLPRALGGSNVTVGRAGAAAEPAGAELRGAQCEEQYAHPAF